jgi:hypothetical protein
LGQAGADGPFIQALSGFCQPPPPPTPGTRPGRLFGKRFILYGVAVAGGTYLAIHESTETSEVCRPVGGGNDCFLRSETSYPQQSIGLGVMGVAVAAAIVDLVIASRRPSASGNAGDMEEAQTSRLRFRRVLPHPSVSPRGVGLQWTVCMPMCASSQPTKR